jgi:CDP-paratose 2-epimerase
LDNLSRSGSEQNLSWIRQQRSGATVDVQIGDVRNPADVEASMRGIDQVFHFAAQVAVTSSLNDPANDFEINARGTLNVLEAIRRQAHPPGLIFTSTNKVYGALENIRLERNGSRYRPANDVCSRGIDESQPLDFHSPYGCSKGAADQYVLDYARTYYIPAVVFRMSCIYGPHQFGTEDQGWVAHFMIRAMDHSTLTIYGDGAQVRDVLFVDDLINALLRAEARITEISGNAFNIGGGPENTISLIELARTLERLGMPPLRIRMEPWRSGDQRYYVSDTGKFHAATGWKPHVSVRDGIARLYDWLGSLRADSSVAGVMQEA